MKVINGFGGSQLLSIVVKGWRWMTGVVGGGEYCFCYCCCGHYCLFVNCCNHECMFLTMIVTALRE